MTTPPGRMHFTKTCDLLSGTLLTRFGQRMENKCRKKMDVGVSAFGLYPQNRSLEEELQRLFAEPCCWRDLREISEDFSHNGVASDYIPRNCDYMPINYIPKNYDTSEMLSSHRPLMTGTRHLQRIQSQSDDSRNNSKRTSQSGIKRKGECVFCRNNGETRIFYQSHVVKDRLGKVTCPVLRNYRCPTCGASGDTAHTLKYCPDNKSRNIIPSVILLKSMRNSTGKRRLPSHFENEESR